jgi:hypothetical protein
MHSRKNDRRAARLMGWLAFAPEAVKNPKPKTKRVKRILESEEEALLRQYERMMEERALYEQMLERAYRNPRRTAYPQDASTKVQSLQFDKDLFTAAEAKAWAKAHGFRYGKVDLGQGNWLRLRQADPENFRPSTFRVIPLREGVQAVIAVPKRSAR